MAGQASGRTCYICGEPGHLARNCSKKKQVVSKPKPVIKCFRCGEEGHIKRECPNSAGGVPAAIRSTSPFLDTHCHLDYLYERFRHQGDFKAFCSRMNYPENFEGCISSFCDPAAFSSFGNWEDLLKQDKVWGAFGLHPHHAKYFNDTLEAKIVSCVSHPKCVAYGEIGLDYSDHSLSDPATQKRVLRRQLQKAVLLNKPVVIHCRNAEDDLLDALTTNLPPDYNIHLHCYSGTLLLGKKFMEHFPNLFIGITANITYPKCNHIRDTVAGLPLERLLLETDAPYLVPNDFPKSCRWSNSGMIMNIAKEISMVMDKPIDEILQHTRANARTLYGI